MKISVMRPAAAIPLAIGGLILIAMALLNAGPNEDPAELDAAAQTSVAGLPAQP